MPYGRSLNDDEPVVYLVGPPHFDLIPMLRSEMLRLEKEVIFHLQGKHIQIARAPGDRRDVTGNAAVQALPAGPWGMPSRARRNVN